MDPNFVDDNSNLLSTLTEKYPDAQTLEMETFYVCYLHLFANLPAVPLGRVLRAKITRSYSDSFMCHGVCGKKVQRFPLSRANILFGGARGDSAIESDFEFQFINYYGSRDTT